MTKLETIAYYEAIHASHRLVTIDSDDTKEQIYNKIIETINNQRDETLYIEIFSNDKNICGYSLVKFSEDIYTLWLQKNNQINNANIDDIAKYIFDNLPSQIISPYQKYIASKTENNCYVIKSYIDDTYEYILNPKNVPMDIMEECIVGQFLLENGSLEYHVANKANQEPLLKYINDIDDERMKLFAKTMIQMTPAYVFEIPAGTSSKLHSASALSKQGLLRNIQNAIQIYKLLIETDYAKLKFTQHERDMMFIATMCCDLFRHGWQEDYEIDKSVKYEHPKLAADVIRSIKGILSLNEINFIANCVESHMGHFIEKPNNSDVILPVPDTEYKHLVLLTQYLATRKELNICNDNTYYVFDTDKIKTIKAYTIISDHDIQTLQNALDKPIDTQIAKSLGIECSPKEIINNWKLLIENKQAFDEQIKYIDLAKQMIFE